LIKQIPSYLKLVTDTSGETSAASEDLAGMIDACQAFEAATGWRLEVAAGLAPTVKTNLMWSAPVNPGVGISPGHIRLFSCAKRPGQPPPIAFESAKQLAAGLGKLWGELLRTRHALEHREAELASGVPVVVRERDEDQPPLGTRLQAVLRAGAQAIGCDAAALYLLDAATTELKLRAAWGLPNQRLTEPPRPLRGALADLEALLGHAVVTNDERLYSYWKVPEQGFAACVCVPVLSQSMPLGTLWAFCTTPRDFSDTQTNILEVVAGRLAVDLEREALVGEAIAARDQARQLALVGDSPISELPSRSPFIDGWDVAANVSHAGQLGGTFYDWFSIDDAGGLAIAAGDALERGVGGALTSAAARAAGRAIAGQSLSPSQAINHINSILWTTSSGRRCTALFQAVLEPGAASCVLAVAGPMRVVVLRSDGHVAIPHAPQPVGCDETIAAAQHRHNFAPGEALLIYGASAIAEAGEAMLELLDDQMAAAFAQRSNASATELAQVALGVLDPQTSQHPAADRVAMVIKRRR
jgi:phosphoserine phosphatase RsbU/P